MNIIEALKIAKEQGKKVRPVGANWCVVYEDIFVNGFFTRIDKIIMVDCEYLASPEEILADWEVVKEKPSKQTQYKIDSMKFQIVRHCKNNVVNDNASCKECIITKTCDKTCKKTDETPYTNALDDWSLKDIVEAYHILKKAGEI